MNQYSILVEDVSIIATRQDNGNYHLVARDSEGNFEIAPSDSMEVSSKELAALLFCSFNEQFSNEEEIYDTARDVQEKLSVQIIP